MDDLVRTGQLSAGTGTGAYPHVCPSCYGGATRDRCIELTGQLHINLRTCCGGGTFEPCNSKERKCRQCLLDGLRGDKAEFVTDVRRGLCARHVEALAQPKPTAPVAPRHVPEFGPDRAHAPGLTKVFRRVPVAASSRGIVSRPTVATSAGAVRNAPPPDMSAKPETMPKKDAPAAIRRTNRVEDEKAAGPEAKVDRDVNPKQRTVSAKTDSVLDESIIATAVEKASGLEGKYLELFLMLRQDVGNIEIAKRLSKSVKTIENTAVWMYKALDLDEVPMRLKRAVAAEAARRVTARALNTSGNKAADPKPEVQKPGPAQFAAPERVPPPARTSESPLLKDRRLDDVRVRIGELDAAILHVLGSVGVAVEGGVNLAGGTAELEDIRKDIERMSEKVFRLHALFIPT